MERLEATFRALPAVRFPNVVKYGDELTSGSGDERLPSPSTCSSTAWWRAPRAAE